MTRVTITLLCAALVSGIFAVARAADQYPSRPVKLVVAFAPGGVADVMGRLVAGALQPRLHQSVIVENKPGGDGQVGMGEVVRAEPDGYTLLVGGFGGQIVPPLMNDDFPFDVKNDLVKIALTAEFGNVLVVNNSLPMHAVPDLIAYLKARPGAVNFGSSGRATSDRLAAEMFMLDTGTKMIDVPYKGGGIALSDLLKFAFARPRPDFVAPAARVFTTSFPSGHAAMSAITYLTIGALLTQTHPAFVTGLFITSIATFFTFAVGVSRIYLGVHYPTDILGGWCVGAGWSMLCWQVMTWLHVGN